jgi:periplasmic protein CpxP/Spy
MTSLIKSTQTATRSVLGPLVLLSLMAGAGFPSYAQTAPEQPKAHHGMMQERDPAKRQEMIVKRQAELKAQLQITAAQEPAWNTFVAGMTPPADRAALRAEMEKLPEAEHQSKMKALRAQREGNANAFYAVLSADQKKVFDEQRKHKGHGRGHGMKAS